MTSMSWNRPTKIQVKIAFKIYHLLFSVSACGTQGTCEPLVEDYLDIFPNIETINIARIAEINSRVLTPTWKAGRTSLIGESFSEVLAYRMGELPANDLERSGDRTAVREFLKEVDDKASAFTIGKKRKKETWVIF